MLAQATANNFPAAPELINNKYLKGTRVPVWLLVRMLNNGMTEEQILKQFPALSSAEIKAAMKFAGSTAVATGI